MPVCVKLKTSVAALAFALLAFGYTARSSGVQSQAADSCAACHKKGDDGVVGLYEHSIHARSGITCNRCHGGDAEAADKQKAHGGRFVGRPSATEVLSMCGACHRPQLAMFKASRHLPEQQGVPRLDCTQCHGAHTVGSPKRDFSFAYYCAGCHGLEYLPELPADFQKMLRQTDSINETLRSLAQAGGKIPEEVAGRRKELRRLVAEIVHSTDSEGAKEKIPHILRLGDQFKQFVEREKR